jgi:sigma-B regulation protein RsbU (phosphoserine phosphatase)
MRRMQNEKSQIEFNEKIRNRMLIQIMSATAVVLLSLGYILYLISHNTIEQQVCKQVTARLAQASERVDSFLATQLDHAVSIAASISKNKNPDSEKIKEWLILFAKEYKSKEGFVGFEDGSYIDPAWTPDEGYDPRKRSWYIETKKLGKPNFTDPYIDGDTGKIILTAAVPLFKNNKFYGVLGVDVTPDKVLKNIKNPGDGKDYMGLVIDSTGRFVVHPDESYVLKKKLQDSKDYKQFEQYTNNNQNSFFPRKNDYIAFWPIKSAGWTAMFKLDRKVVDKPVNLMTMFFVTGAVVAMFVLALAIVLVCQVLSRPILKLADGAGKITNGNYDYRVEIQNKDEIGFLTHSFNQMAVGLKEREKIRGELEISKSEQARLEGELQAGHEIQMAMLPEKFPEADKFSLYAIYHSAKEVGGDFYDFFGLPDGRMAFVIGDVSGKGVPAALFMANTSVALRMSCPHAKDPASALSAANDTLAKHNPTNMFVTVFLVYYDPETGKCDFASGGHNPPIIIRKDGKTEYTPEVTGCVLGPFEGMEFENSSFTLGIGDAISLYTDGIPEAHSPDKVLFSEERYEKLLTDNRNGSVKDICELTLKTVMEYQQSNQFDDITMLMWKREK